MQDNNVDDTKVITELLLQSDLDSNANDWGHIAEVVELEIDYDFISIVPECVDKFQKIVHNAKIGLKKHNLNNQRSKPSATISNPVLKLCLHVKYTVKPIFYCWRS